jgi:hypothetical protein
MLFYSISLNKTLSFTRVLSSTVKLYHPECKIYLIHGEEFCEEIDISKEPFDKILFFKDLGIENYNSWIFQFNTKEVCNAIQPFAMNYLLNNTNYEKIFYLNNKIYLFNDLDDVNKLLDIYPIVITPYLLKINTFYSSIHDNESHNLNNGLYSPNFIALANTKETKEIISAFLNYYIDYTTNFINFQNYNFQSLFDLLPFFYTNIHILRDYGYNVSTSNLIERTIDKNTENKYTSNGTILKFFDFNGFETGEGRLNKIYLYPGSEILNELWTLYESEINKDNSIKSDIKKCSLDYFSNNQRISDEMRKYYRKRVDVQEMFPNPQIVDNKDSIVLSFSKEFKRQHSSLYKTYIKLKKLFELILSSFRK